LQLDSTMHYTSPAGFDGRRSEWVVHSLFLLPESWFEASNRMSQTELTEEIRSELAAIAESAGCELLDCQFRGGVLRLVVDRSGGVTLEDCQSVSRQTSALLDVVDFGLGRYTLEVSSPGLDRQFYRESDFERFCGEKIRVTWHDPEMPHKRTDIGTLVEYSADRGEILLTVSPGDETFQIPLKHIQLARLEPEY
jgi:ribosome maturation factor RimP